MHSRPLNADSETNHSYKHRLAPPNCSLRIVTGNVQAAIIKLPTAGFASVAEINGLGLLPRVEYLLEPHSYINVYSPSGACSVERIGPVLFEEVVENDGWISQLISFTEELNILRHRSKQQLKSAKLRQHLDHHYHQGIIDGSDDGIARFFQLVKSYVVLSQTPNSVPIPRVLVVGRSPLIKLLSCQQLCCQAVKNDWLPTFVDLDSSDYVRSSCTDAFRLPPQTIGAVITSNMICLGTRKTILSDGSVTQGSDTCLEPEDSNRIDRYVFFVGVGDRSNSTNGTGIIREDNIMKHYLTILAGILHLHAIGLTITPSDGTAGRVPITSNQNGSSIDFVGTPDRMNRLSSGWVINAPMGVSTAGLLELVELFQVTHIAIVDDNADYYHHLFQKVSSENFPRISFINHFSSPCPPNIPSRESSVLRWQQYFYGLQLPTTSQDMSDANDNAPLHPLTVTVPFFCLRIFSPAPTPDKDVENSPVNRLIAVPQTFSKEEDVQALVGAVMALVLSSEDDCLVTPVAGFIWVRNIVVLRGSISSTINVSLLVPSNLPGVQLVSATADVATFFRTTGILLLPTPTNTHHPEIDEHE